MNSLSFQRPLLITSLVAALTFVATCSWYFWNASSEQTTDSAFVDGHRVAVASQAAGRVDQLLVDDNQHVEVGQILLRIDPADYQVKLDQAEAAQAQADGALAQARAHLPVIKAAAHQAEAQVKVAEANALKSTDDLARYRQLSDDAISQITFDAAKTQVAVSAAQVDAARQAALAAQAQIALAQSTVTTAEATVRAAAAQVSQARLTLSYCELKAPVAGYVTRKTVEAGNYIQVGQPLFNLVTDELYVTANFKETQLTHLRSGQRATFTVDTYPGVTFTGRVDSCMAGTGSAFALLPPENATGNFVKVVQRVPVKIIFDKTELYHLPKLAVGMSVVATVDVSRTTSDRSQTVSFNR